MLTWRSRRPSRKKTSLLWLSWRPQVWYMVFKPRISWVGDLTHQPNRREMTCTPPRRLQTLWNCTHRVHHCWLSAHWYTTELESPWPPECGSESAPAHSTSFRRVYPSEKVTQKQLHLWSLQLRRSCNKPRQPEEWSIGWIETSTGFCKSSLVCHLESRYSSRLFHNRCEQKKSLNWFHSSTFGSCVLLSFKSIMFPDEGGCLTGSCIAVGPDLRKSLTNWLATGQRHFSFLSREACWFHLACFKSDNRQFKHQT